jgi:hypothetical protein
MTSIRFPEATEMATEPRRTFDLSLDWWAVLSALAALGLIKAGFITRIPW